MFRLMTGLLIFLLVNTAYSLNRVAPSAEEISPIEVGVQIPNVFVKEKNGVSRKLSDWSSRKPTAVIFFRGGWCAYCNNHLKDLAKAQKSLLDLGFQIIAISPDSPEEVSRSSAALNLDYQLLSDSQFVAARAFGVAFRLDQRAIDNYRKYGSHLKQVRDQGYLMPVPSVFLVSTSGEVIYRHADGDYKNRINPAALLDAAAQMRK